MPSLYDTHCHLYLKDYAIDLESVIQRARESGIEKILVPGVDMASSRQAIELSDRYSGTLFAAAGIHPNDSSGCTNEEIRQIRDILNTHREICAVGEIGLDFYRTWSPCEDQLYVFNEMLKLSADFNLPVCLHVREAAEEVISVLEGWHSDLLKHNHPLAKNPGVFHSFDGNPLIAQWAVQHDFMVGVSGTVTYPKAQNIRDSLSAIGIDHIITETDGPYLSPQAQRGKRNEPVFVQYTAEEISRSLGIDLEVIEEKTRKNADHLFKWPVA